MRGSKNTMDVVALHILKAVAERGEISLAAAIRMARSRHKDHLDQYPLALLLEDGYLGATIKNTPPDGAEEMREFSLATTLHMFSLGKDASGAVDYLGIRSTGTINPEKERVFLRAKGALYLDEHNRRIRDRFWSFVLGFGGGVLAAIVTAWIKGRLSLP
jgi:hypothetical protein